MNAETNDMFAIVQEQADRLLAQQVTRERLSRADEGLWQVELWAMVAESGLPLALVPEAQNGIGLTAPQALGLIRRAAYHALPLPLAETILANAAWAAASGKPLDGPLSIAPTNPRDGFTIAPSADGYSIRGSAARVPWGKEAVHVLLQCRDGAGADFLVCLASDEGRWTRRLNLANEPRDSLDLSGGVTVPAEQVRPMPDSIAGLLEQGALVRSYQMVGAMQRALDHAVAYAIERRQFGKAIGKFQAIQQMLAEAAGHYAAGDAAVERAGQRYGATSFAFDVAVAKARTGEAAGKLAEICHQVHGAMGFTQEHPLHFSTRRLWAWRDEFGNESYWQERIGRAACAGGGEALWPMLADN